MREQHHVDRRREHHHHRAGIGVFGVRGEADGGVEGYGGGEVGDGEVDVDPGVGDRHSI